MLLEMINNKQIVLHMLITMMPAIVIQSDKKGLIAGKYMCSLYYVSQVLYKVLQFCTFH